MARKSTKGADGLLVKTRHWKYEGVEADLSSLLAELATSAGLGLPAPAPRAHLEAGE